MFHRLFFIGLLIYTFSVVHVTSSDSEQVKVSGVDHLLDENTQEGLTDENSRDIEEDADFDEEMLYYGLDLGTPQTLYDDFEEQSVEKIVQARSYMKNEGSAANKSCRNNHESCAYWAVAGECERAQQFMARTCAPMCGFCHMKEPEPDCAVSDNALQPGDLNILFERIVSDPALKQFEPRVISRPTLAPGDTIGSAEYIVGGPWLVVFENTLSDEETDRLIELGNKKGFLRSMNGGAAFNGAFQQSVDTKRTSETAWCDQECLDDSLAFGVVSRIENITSIPHGYSEHLQLLRYTDGQYYKLVGGAFYLFSIGSTLKHTTHENLTLPCVSLGFYCDSTTIIFHKKCFCRMVLVF